MLLLVKHNDGLVLLWKKIWFLGRNRVRLFFFLPFSHEGRASSLERRGGHDEGDRGGRFGGPRGGRGGRGGPMGGWGRLKGDQDRWVCWSAENDYPGPVLAFGYYHCLCLSVCRCVCQHWACPCNDLWVIQTRITKFGPEVKNTFVKINFTGWLTWTSRSILT